MQIPCLPYIKLGHPHLQVCFEKKDSLQQYILGISLLQNEPSMIKHLKWRKKTYIFWKFCAESPHSYIIVYDMTMSGKKYDVDKEGCCEEILIQHPLLIWSSHVQWYQSKDSLSKQQMANHRTTNLTKIQQHEHEFIIDDNASLKLFCDPDFQQSLFQNCYTGPVYPKFSKSNKN